MTHHTDVLRSLDEGALTEAIIDQGAPVLRFPDPLPVDLSAISIPGYEVLGELGRGGMGTVYKARQVRLNRLVALKVIHGGPLADPVQKARFHMEAEAVARLQHKNIVQVYDVGNHAGVEYIAFEFVDGPTVRQWQDWKAVEPMVAARVASAVARGIQHAHDRGIVHRDLKPANVLLAGARRPRIDTPAADSSDGPPTMPDPEADLVPKVMDFGLAKALEGNTHLTESGVACGTPNYMAPEQVRGGPAAALPAVDVWGLGAVLFELLTGRPPFTGWNAAAIMQDILMCEPPAVGKIAGAVPYDLTVIVAKCLEKDPARRYLTPGDAADDLDRFVAGKPIIARPASSVRRARRWIARNPMPALVGAVLLLGLGVVGALAMKLDDLASGERTARQEAEAAKAAAEQARDEAQGAKAKAEGERDRAEGNLGIARQTVSQVLGTLASHDTAENAAVVPVYRSLLAGIEPFVGQMLAQQKGDRELRFDQAAIVRARGFMELTSGRLAEARTHLVHATTLYRALARDYPADRLAQRELAVTLSHLASVFADAANSDSGAILREGMTALERYLADYPDDVPALDAMVRVRLALVGDAGDSVNDEHNYAVLQLADRLSGLGMSPTRVQMLKAHALNNIASGLTNREKTDEAELYWKEVLAIRETVYRAAPGDKLMRYELAKCLINYSNQMLRTGRHNEYVALREKAAGLFDTLNDDAAFRATYVQVMVDNDLQLASEYNRRGVSEKALVRLSNAIVLTTRQLEHDPSAMRYRGYHADLHTRRAEVHERAGRHDRAARDYRTAAAFSTNPPHRDYCSAKWIQEQARAGDHRGAAASAEKLDLEALSHPFPCLELARGWLLIARAASADPCVPLLIRDRAVAEAVENARTAVRAAEKRCLFDSADMRNAFHSDRDFEPVWEMIPKR